MGFYNKDLRFNELKNYRAGEKNIGQVIGKGFSGLGKIKQDAQDREDNAQKELYLKKMRGAQMRINAKNASLNQSRFDLEKDKIDKADKETVKSNKAKISLMNKYLKSQKIDPNKYSDEEKLRGGDMIEKIHTDPSDFKFSRTYQFKNGKIVAEYKNKKGKFHHEVVFDARGKDKDKEKDFDPLGTKYLKGAKYIDPETKRIVGRRGKNKASDAIGDFDLGVEKYFDI